MLRVPPTSDPLANRGGGGEREEAGGWIAGAGVWEMGMG